jgi:thiamine biosynthesis lipoprotein
MKTRDFEHSFSLMGTKIEFKFFTDLGTIEAQDVIKSAQSEFHRVNKTYTRFDQSSELSRLNKHFKNKTTPYSISAEFFNLIELMLKLARSTKGKYDPTVIDLLEMHGYANSFDRESIKKIRKQNKHNLSKMALEKYLEKRPTWKTIKLDKEKSTVKLAKGQRLDLGSIGKGFAMDLAAEEFIKAGIENFLISAGGDIYAHGINKNTGESWKVDLAIKSREKSKANVFGQIELRESGQAIASSGSWSRSVGKFHHLLNTSTGKPNKEILQTFVISTHATFSDVLATASYVLGDEIKNLTEINAETLIIKSDEKIFASEGFPEFTI